MHKIFAKPVFLGKKVVFLPQCHSTNDEMAGMTKNESQPEGLVLYTDHQLNGKGQRGNIWLDEPGKNILMSVLLKPNRLAISDQYYLNLITGLSVLNTLEKYGINCMLKWPNDVYAGEKKIAGILIENSLKGVVIETSIVGIGLNLNQKGFNLKTATSVILEAGEMVKKEDLMEDILISLEKWYLLLSEGRKKEILDAYHANLMWINQEREFRANNEIFLGIIEGIDLNGMLVINDMNGKIRKFNVREVEFVR